MCYLFVGVSIVADRVIGAIETIRKSSFTPTSVWGYSRGLTLFSYPACWILRMDEPPVDAWLYFPGLKVGKMFLYYSLMTTGFEINRDIVRNTIIFELGCWLWLFSLAGFFYSVRVGIKLVTLVTFYFSELNPISVVKKRLRVIFPPVSKFT